MLDDTLKYSPIYWMKYNIRIKQRKKSHVIFHKKGGDGVNRNVQDKNFRNETIISSIT